jgi:hypothetical protein
MKTKTTKKPKKTARKTVRDEAGLKAFGRLEEIKKDLVLIDEGKDIGLFSLLARQTPGVKEADSKNTLVIKVVHVSDDGKENEPTEKERELDRKIEGKD